MKSKLSATAERVDWVLKKVWGGSQTRMAEEIGVSQSAISNVVTGRQEPGRRFLALVASNSLINSTWIITGQGDPLVTLGSEAGRRAAYVARRLFEGRTDEHGDCLGHMLEVPLPFYRPSRYWLQIDGASPLTEVEQLKIAVGDIILFEPDPNGWPSDLANHPCVRKTVDQGLCVDSIMKSNSRKFWTMNSGTQALPKLKPGEKHPPEITFRDESPQASGSGDDHSHPLKALVAVGVLRMGDFGTPANLR